MVNPVKYVEACGAKNAPTGEALKVAKEAAAKAKEEVTKMAEDAYKAAHDTFKNVQETGADKLAEAYRAAHGIM